MQLESGSGPGLLDAGSGSFAGTKVSSHTERLVDAFEASARPKTLMERHQEKQEREQKKRKKAGDKGAAQDWDPSTQPWRPFDRERDLAVPDRKSVV